MAVVACDAYKALGPGADERIALTYVGPTSVIAGDTILLDVLAERDGAPLEQARIEAASSDPSVLSVTAQGTLAAHRRGSATLTVKLRSAVLPGGAIAITQDIRVVAGAIGIQPTGVTLQSLGDSARLSAMVVDAHGEPLTGVPIEWASADTTIVVVDARGTVRAVRNGAVQLTARIPNDDVEATTMVRVEQRIEHLVFGVSSLLFDALGAEATLAVTGQDANGSPAPVGSVTLESCNPAIVSVSLAGVARAISNGRTCLTASTPGLITQTLPVEVDQRATRVEVRAANGLTIPALGGALQLTAIGFDRLNVAVADARPRWFSRDPSIAQVDTASGRVIGVGVGDAEIAAAMDDAVGAVLVSVRNLAASIEVRPPSVTLTSIGDTVRLTATLTNALGDPVTSGDLTWRSSDPLVAEALPSGDVIGRSVGTALLIATSNGLADTSAITVRNDPAFIDIVRSVDSLPWVGATKTLTLVVRNARGNPLSPSSVTWTSSDRNVARVSTVGVATAVGEGETYVRAASGALADSVLIVVSSRPTQLTLDSDLDTLTAVAQELAYVVSVRNGAGAAMPIEDVVWRSTDVTVARVDSRGVVTAIGYGMARIIAAADTVADTVRVVVVNPTRVYVDNSVVASPRIGTLARPYLRVQDALSAADAFDTVIVRRGAAAYDESIELTRRVTLLGDSSAFVAAGRDPNALPVIAHDTGAVAIRAYTTAPVEIRYLGVRHSLDGWALETRGADVALEHIYVNPNGDAFATGRGIAVTNAPTLADLRSISVREVRGAGIRLDRVVGARLTDVTVTRVVASSDLPGAGIDVVDGRAASITRATVRGTAGPQVQLAGTDGASIIQSDFAGESQLVRANAVLGATIIEGNRFDLRRQAGEPFTGTSETDGRSGLEVRASAGVLVRNNDFVDASGVTSRMDAVRLIDARGGSYGARLESNRFGGGRQSVRSERSTWELASSRSDSASLAIVATAGDVVTLSGVTLTRGIDGCISATSAALTVTSLQLDKCGSLTIPGLTATGGSLALTGATVTGSAGRAIVATATSAATVRGATILSAGGPTSGANGRGALELAGTFVEAVGNAVRGFAVLAGIDVNATTARVDSNSVSLNMYGVRVAQAAGLTTARNDMFDNLTAGLINDDAAAASFVDSWWGDARGPRGGADPDAVGDPVVGTATTIPVSAAANFPGTTISTMRVIRGTGQSAAVNVPLAQRFSVRVVDATGRPVPGVPVLFDAQTSNRAVFENGLTTMTVMSNASGLGEARLTITRSATTINTRVSATGSATTLTFSASTP